MSNLTQFSQPPLQRGWPFLFPTLFGNGADGAVTTAGAGAGNIADGGYLGAYGPKQFTQFKLASGDTILLPTGSSNGALIIACKGTLEIAGTISGNGDNGANAATGHSGAGGGSAGSGAGAAQVTTETFGTNGLFATKRGHGVMSPNIPIATPAQNTGAMGGGSGARKITAAGVSIGSVVWCPATLSDGPRGFNNLGIYETSVGGVSITGTTATNGTTAPIAAPNPYGFNSWMGVVSLGWLAPGITNGSGGVTVPVGGGLEACGGGSGGGGGVLYIEADTIVLTAGYAINLNGGNGGNGYSGNGTTAVGGGGSGAGGGTVVLVCRTLIGSTGAISTSGGSAGTGAGTGAASGLAGPAGGFLVIKI